MKRNHMKARIFALVIAVAVLLTPTVAFAADEDAGPLTVVNNLNNTVFAIVRALGILGALFGLIQVGMSFSNHDASQRMQGFMILAGAAIIIFAKEILTGIGAM